MIKFYAFLLVSLLGRSGDCNAQDHGMEQIIKYESHKEVVDFAVSDTSVGYNFFIPIKVKFKNSPEIQIYAQQTWIFYQYFQEQYGWSASKFFETMREIVYFDEVINEDEMPGFKFGTLISEKECKCYFNSEQEVNTFIEKDTKPPNAENKFPCFVYKLFKLNVLLSYAEEKMNYSDFRKDIKKN